jgi:TldD protein
MAGLAGEYEVVLVARSDGVLAADVRPLVRLSVQVIASRTAGASRAAPAAAGASTTRTSPTRCSRTTRRAVHQALVNLESRGRRRPAR